MVFFRLFTLAAVLLLWGCSDSADSTIDDLAEKGKELVENARDMSEDASQRLTEDLSAAREKASEQLNESVKLLRED